MPLLFCSAPFRCRSHPGYSLARLSELCPSLSSRVFAFAVRRVSARCRSFARLCFSLSMPSYALPCCALASPRCAVPLPCCALASLLVSMPALCTAVPCFAVSLPCHAGPSRLRAVLFRFRSNPSSALAVPVDATLRLCLQCFSDAGRGYANQCRCNSHRYVSSLFLCRSILCVAYAAHRVSSPSLIGAYPRPIKSYRLPGLSILRFAYASLSATIHFCSGA